jgi:hypothetical protein
VGEGLDLAGHAREPFGQPVVARGPRQRPVAPEVLGELAMAAAARAWQEAQMSSFRRMRSLKLFLSCRSSCEVRSSRDTTCAALTPKLPSSGGSGPGRPGSGPTPR